MTELLQGRGLKDLDVFTPPTFDDEEVAEHTNLETHFIDSSGLISWDLFKQDADYPFVDWNFSGTTEEEFATLMAIFNKEDKEVYTTQITGYWPPREPSYAKIGKPSASSVSIASTTAG